ncbi:antibiotic biosynthesis monooxygenase family protein [Longimicrobium sp.]|uniref:antibiotic biosynthesis monooxygenase family protein n=1 Tax=Longimicrobium sp. TaxID=2029185 RepID=UPI002E2F13EC|nr:antibiotic biosynthesis monooxygenase family protein [Longimicrobium sp.]HEX6042741.1 antibiotic biosynthesis monooxygenase family protein [Longimicrobium sp.]
MSSTTGANGAGTMIVEYIRYEIAEDRAAEFEAAYARASASLDASPHCLAYELTRCVEAPASYILRIEWESEEGHMQGFRRGPEFPAFLAAIRPYVGDIAEMRHYARTTVGARKQAAAA